ncbi:flagellar filament capping protein FliD [Sulfurospirillum sp. 1612]|uniref:flagellar filament capping protein FliD n=1 Tax=Sulfurospirillum sp. 1612 TaxID=3094835 RepID=UPI002F958B99
MATSSLSSLGIGSSGVLSSDVLDQLRSVDEKAIITPITDKITANQTKTTDLAKLTTLVATLKSNTSALASESTYFKNTVTTSSDNATVTAEDGVSAQDFSLNVTKIAKPDIYQSDSFSSENSTFTSADDTLNFNIDGKDYSVDVTASMTINDLKNKIYDATDGKIIASTLNVGGDTPYRLTFKSANTGTDNAITITSTGSAASDLGLDTAANHIQTATNAEFTYNNINITRQTNTVDDLIVGVTININHTGESNVSITQDTDSIVSNISDFVDNYNTLISSLTSSTGYDSSTQTAGVFQGTSEIRDLKSALSRQLFEVNSDGKSLSDYGVTLNSAGTLEFDQTALEDKIKENSSDVEDFFRGTGTSGTGYFTDFNSLLDTYTNTSTGILTGLDTQYSTQATSLSEEKEKATASLDSKYDALTSKFIAYDAVISNLNSSFQSLSMQIDALSNNSSSTSS